MKPWLWDLLAAIGALLVGIGLGAIYWPLAALAWGLGLVAMGFWGAKLHARQKGE